MIMEEQLLIAGFLIGIFCGIMMSATEEKYDADSATNRIQLQIDLCEKSLPRYQHCVLTAVPERKGE